MFDVRFIIILMHFNDQELMVTDGSLFPSSKSILIIGCFVFYNWKLYNIMNLPLTFSMEDLYCFVLYDDC